VVSMESLVELGLRHLVAFLKSGGELSPPSTGGPRKLLGCVQSPVELSIVQEPKLGLGDAKPVICLKQFKQLGEWQRVCCQ
jgi:hypothetical protein